MRRGRFGHPFATDAEVTQLIESGHMEPSGLLVEQTGYLTTPERFDHPDDERQVAA